MLDKKELTQLLLDEGVIVKSIVPHMFFIEADDNDETVSKGETGAAFNSVMYYGTIAGSIEIESGAAFRLWLKNINTFQVVGDQYASYNGIKAMPITIDAPTLFDKIEVESGTTNVTNMGACFIGYIITTTQTSQ